MNVMTFTNTLNSMIAVEDIEGAVNILSSGGLVLFPTDTIWTIGCDLENTDACQKLLRLKSNLSHYGIEILVHSLKMFKNYVPSLHPKIETLLYYHTRPLSVLIQQPHRFPTLKATSESLSVRLTRDDFCQHLIQELGRPIFSSFATVNDDFIPKSFGGISSSILQNVDFVAKHRQLEKNEGHPAVVVTLSDKDELIFLRE